MIVSFPLTWMVTWTSTPSTQVQLRTNSSQRPFIIMKKNRSSVRDQKQLEVKKKRLNQAVLQEDDQGIHVSSLDKTVKNKSPLVKYSSQSEELILTHTQIRSIQETRQVTCKSGTCLKSWANWKKLRTFTTRKLSKKRKYRRNRGMRRWLVDLHLRLHSWRRFNLMLIAFSSRLMIFHNRLYGRHTKMRLTVLHL